MFLMITYNGTELGNPVPHRLDNYGRNNPSRKHLNHRRKRSLFSARGEIITTADLHVCMCLHHHEHQRTMNTLKHDANGNKERNRERKNGNKKKENKQSTVHNYLLGGYILCGYILCGYGLYRVGLNFFFTPLHDDQHQHQPPLTPPQHHQTAPTPTLPGLDCR